MLAARRLRSLVSACVFAQAIRDGSVFTDVSVVVEGDRGEISTLSITCLTRLGAYQKGSQPAEADRRKVKRAEGKDMEGNPGSLLWRHVFGV